MIPKKIKENPYICSKCGANVFEDDLTKVIISFGKRVSSGKGEIHYLCPACIPSVMDKLKGGV